MQDSFLRLMGVMGALAGAYIIATDRLWLGTAIVVLGLLAVLKTTRMPFRRFGPWRPHVAGKGEDQKTRLTRKQRAESRMQRASKLGPSARRGDVHALDNRD